MFVTYNPNATSPIPVGQLGSGTDPNPIAVLTLSSTEQSLIIANDPTSILVDTTTSPPSVVSNPNFWTQRGPYYISQQIAAVTAGFKAALAAPFAFTNAAGVATSYATDPNSLFIYSQAYTNYVLGGKTLPSGFTIRDVNGTPQTFTTSDIKNLYTGIVNFTQSCNASFNSLVANIKASTSYSNCVSYNWTTP